MKARPVRISGDRENGFLVHVPIGRDGVNEATLDLDDYNELVSFKVYPNWQLRGGQVGARGPLGIEVLIARVLTNAEPGQRVLYVDGSPFNLRRGNLDLQDWGSSIRHDRGELIEAHAEFERRKLIEVAAGSYHPRFWKPEIFQPDRITKPRQPGARTLGPNFIPIKAKALPVA
ncbi:hypothetical protein [Mesorhizobium retamae]|uniref:Uncharacterized protein n=1 Tax=Mesorhizobium retamae TaxID=2912854 RepID=A0ABS9QDP4_9HYPH|nr:hypothetical protein [Mesorhizobium sp. IRAMC:0171]MCG7504764.1 hypothetical protein [Mesorhizobium sp. IRAMC:0171]